MLTFDEYSVIAIDSKSFVVTYALPKLKLYFQKPFLKINCILRFYSKYGMNKIDAYLFKTLVSLHIMNRF